MLTDLVGVEIKEIVSEGILYIKVDLRDPGDWAKIAFCPQQSTNIKASEFLQEGHAAYLKDLSMGFLRKFSFSPFLLALFSPSWDTSYLSADFYVNFL